MLIKNLLQLLEEGKSVFDFINHKYGLKINIIDEDLADIISWENEVSDILKDSLFYSRWINIGDYPLLYPLGNITHATARNLFEDGKKAIYWLSYLRAQLEYLSEIINKIKIVVDKT